MSLASLTVSNLRNLRQVQLDLHPKHNLIWGANASGKTSLLEAIFLLGRGRSFRTRSSEKLMTHQENTLVVFGQTHDSPPQSIGVQVSRADGVSAKINGSFSQSLTALSQVFPVQVIEPGIHKLLEDGANKRRRWIDWGVFHVEPSFLENWSSYTRAVKQRNAALRQRAQHVEVWDGELSRLGTLIAEQRRQFLQQLQPYWLQCTQALMLEDLELHYFRGWAQDSSLAEALQTQLERDLKRGATHAGPHRADVQLRIGQKSARDVFSRGQQKLAAIAMVLAQLELIAASSGHIPTLLLDDPAAELDPLRLQLVTERIKTLRCQLIVTSLSANRDPFGHPDRVFHVEHGVLTTV
jgi:DNA replication and repair protein RecF